ncbi:unnamed protein product [Pipistrellus nathusii]|uniref:Uncharacterized protein n=1 Tax=Pipistrellus nathusii TaxID=59473 RepID=A0ABN9ZF16_PIPNA
MDSLSCNSAEGSPRKDGAAKQPSPGVKGKAKASRTSTNIPKIVVTSASNEILSRSPEQRTIREEVVFGPYARHRNPSTIDAYALISAE